MSEHRRCPECGTAFQPRQKTQRFCMSIHKQSWNNRRIERGLVLYKLAVLWRRTRVKGSLAELTRTVDGFLREDRERKRESL